MKKLFSNRQAGIGHVELIIGIVIVLALAGVGYFVYSKNKNSGSSGGNVDLSSVQEALKNAKCDYDDEDLCKFFTSQGVMEFSTMTTVSEMEGQTSKTTLIKDGDKTHTKFEGHISYEVIAISDATYTKAADGTWWKQSSSQSQNNYLPDTGSDVSVSIEKPESAEVVKLRYKKLGKEACGSLTCFKYQETDPADPSTVIYYWFDAKDYLLRRTVTEGPNGKSDTTISYDNKVSIKEPSPVKELGPNQILIPGDSEPQTIPSFN